MPTGLNILITAENAQALAALQQTQAGVQQLGQKAALTAAQIKATGRALTQSLSGLALAAGTLGGNQVTAALYPLMFLGKELKAVAASMKLAGLGAGTAGVAIASLTAVVSAGVTAWQAYNAQLAEHAARAALEGQETGGKLKLLRELRAMQKELRPDAAAALQAVLDGADAMTLSELARAARPYYVSDAQRRAKSQLAGKLEELTAASLADSFEREREEARIAWRAERKRIAELAAAAGNTADFNTTTGPMYDLARAAYENKVAAIDAREAAEQKALAEKEAAEQLRREKEYHEAIADLIEQEERDRQRQIAATQTDWRLTEAEKYQRLSGLGVPSGELGTNPMSFAEQWQAATVQIKNAFGSLAQTLTSGAFTLIQQGVNGISDAITGIVLGTKSAAQAFGQFGLQMLASFISMVVNAMIWAYLAIPVLTALGVLSGGATAQAGAPATIAAVSGALGAVNGMVGARAAGGPVRGGSPYLVGERGPELYIPDASGTILPAHLTEQVLRGGAGVAGGRTVNQTLHIYQDKQAWLDACRDDIEGIALDAVARNKYRFRA